MVFSQNEDINPDPHVAIFAFVDSHYRPAAPQLRRVQDHRDEGVRTAIGGPVTSPGAGRSRNIRRSAGSRRGSGETSILP